MLGASLDRADLVADLEINHASSLRLQDPPDSTYLAFTSIAYSLICYPKLTK